MNDMAMNYGPAAAAILLGCLAIIGPGWGMIGAFCGCVLCLVAPLCLGWPGPAIDPAVAGSIRDIDCMVGGILFGIMFVFMVRWQERRVARMSHARASDPARPTGG